MEFQFGTNWSRFSQLTGGVIGQPLAMEGVFSFFLESAFLGMFLFGEKRLGRIGHWWAGVPGVPRLLAVGILHRRDQRLDAAPGRLPSPARRLVRGHQLLGRAPIPGRCSQYAHTMSGAVITGAFVMAAVGAFYLLMGQHAEFGRMFLRVGVIAGVVAQRCSRSFRPATCTAATWPRTSRYDGRHGGAFRHRSRRAVVILGQPDVERRAHRQSDRGQQGAQLPDLRHDERRGQRARPVSRSETGPPIFRCSTSRITSWRAWARSSSRSWRSPPCCSGGGCSSGPRWMLWLLMLAFPFPYIANTAGWMTAEVGRQPWLVYGLLRTAGRLLRQRLGREWPVHAARLHGNLRVLSSSCCSCSSGRSTMAGGDVEEPLRAGARFRRPRGIPWRPSGLFSWR